MKLLSVSTGDARLTTNRSAARRPARAGRCTGRGQRVRALPLAEQLPPHRGVQGVDEGRPRPAGHERGEREVSVQHVVRLGGTERAAHPRSDREGVLQRERGIALGRHPVPEHPNTVRTDLVQRVVAAEICLVITVTWQPCRTSSAASSLTYRSSPPSLSGATALVSMTTCI